MTSESYFRVTAWILRFVNNLKDTRKAREKIYKTKFLLSEEISNAKKDLDQT